MDAERSASSSRRRLIFALGVVVIAAALSAAGVLLARGSDASDARAPMAMTDGADVAARFASLSRARSNRCGLNGTEVMQMSDTARLQGSCCTPMDLAGYRHQLRELARYASYPEVPRDPYDISVPLAKRLLSYRAIELSPAQQATLEQAMKRENGHGPCCCKCWRWEAFEGQAKALIARRRFTAAQVASVWKAEDGCGGAHGKHEM